MSLERLLNPFDDVLTYQKRFRAFLGVKEVDRPTYELQEPARRYNAKYWLESWGRGYWDQPIKEMFARQEDVAVNRLKRDKSSYGLIGKALADAAGIRARSHPFETRRWPNVGWLSWSPLRTPTYQRVGIPRWPPDNPTATATLIKRVALWLGASLVGLTTLNRRWVYSHWTDLRSTPPRNPPIVFSDDPGYEPYTRPTQLDDGTQIIPATMRYVIAIASEEDYETLKTAPSDLHTAGIRLHGYAQVTQTTAALAEFLRGLGYHAIPSVGDTCLKTPIAMDAGLGEDGRFGLLITPEYGPRVRLGAVITDLPLTPDRPITFGVHRFCTHCSKCAEACPTHAIPHGPRTFGTQPNDVDAPTLSTHPGALRWIVNHERCVSFLSGGCGICRRTCPWNKPHGPLHTAAKYLSIHGGPRTIRTLVRLDDLAGYGKRLTPHAWWTTTKPGPH